MRLLKTETYQLFEENDIPHPFPQYAILSHTWISPKDEITYQDFKQRKSDIENDIFKQKGWAKLRRYCDRAARDGWEWAWMDTCCIDKTNPADTQEAINAMFRWYQNSGICYAHLDDVDVSRVLDSQDCLGSGQADLDTVAGKNNTADPASFAHMALKAFLIKAKWFTRGWTLQELLAPPYLVFVDQGWRRLGTRESWAEEIKKASRIDAKHLTSFEPTDFTSCSIAMRLSWASGRETTIEEDETYSLLGLFGISLPLIYGEGRWQAFNRLQRELINFYNDDSIFAWKVGKETNVQFSNLQQNDRDTGRGILAHSIREFWDASEIKALGLYDNSFSMTNRGLEINSKRWRHSVEDPRCFILLKCGFETSRRICIPLEHVDDSYKRIHLGETWDMSTVDLEAWVEEPGSQLTIVRASNHTSVLISSSTFVLQWPEKIHIGKKYLVDFRTSNAGVKLKPLDVPGLRESHSTDEIIMEANQLIFINIELENDEIRYLYDVVINTTERSFPSIGLLSRSKAPWERLGDPLEQDTYEHLADHLHFKVSDNPTYPVIAVENRGDIVLGVCLFPKPRQERPHYRTLGKAKTATAREYLLKITVDQGSDQEAEILERRSKRRRQD